MDINFWKSRKVFVTGHTGFKGSWLSLWLLSMGAEVCGYSLEPPTEPSLYETVGLAGAFKSVTGDISNRDLLESTLREFAPEVVIHLAAQPLVRLSYQNPVETYATNVMGTVHLLDAMRRCPSTRAAVMVTSDKCYENQEWYWPYREQEPMGGHDPYSSSKGCAELVTSAYRRSFFAGEGATAIASARAGNVIGGGDWALDRLVPDVMRAWGAGQSAQIRNPLAVRPWQHVLEPLSGYLLLAERLYRDGAAVAEAWNFGPKDSDVRTVRDLISHLAQHWGKDARWQAVESDGAPHEAHLLRLDSSKARVTLGWTPRWNFEETLEHTTEWYKRFYGGGDMKACTLDQIKQYMSSTEQKSSDVSA